jgi:hypothetical protein
MLNLPDLKTYKVDKEDLDAFFRNLFAVEDFLFHNCEAKLNMHIEKDGDYIYIILFEIATTPSNFFYAPAVEGIYKAIDYRLSDWEVA